MPDIERTCCPWQARRSSWVRRKVVRTETHRGAIPEAAWYWNEGHTITDPDRRAQFEALELLAAFLKDGDTKAVQNRLGCVPDEFDKKTGICRMPVMAVHDFGNSLGSDGLLFGAPLIARAMIDIRRQMRDFRPLLADFALVPLCVRVHASEYSTGKYGTRSGAYSRGA